MNEKAEEAGNLCSKDFSFSISLFSHRKSVFEDFFSAFPFGCVKVKRLCLIIVGVGERVRGRHCNDVQICAGSDSCLITQERASLILRWGGKNTLATDGFSCVTRDVTERSRLSMKPSSRSFRFSLFMKCFLIEVNRRAQQVLSTWLAPGTAFVCLSPLYGFGHVYARKKKQIPERIFGYLFCAPKVNS